MGSSGSVSAALGWAAIACWVGVFTPQIVTNYRRQSGEALGVLAMVIWVLGDLTNLAGSIMARMLPTAIILAVYYLCCDLVMVAQIFYYRWKNTAIRDKPGLAYTPLHSRGPTVDDSDASDADDLDFTLPDSISGSAVRSAASRRRKTYVSAAVIALILGLAVWSIFLKQKDEGVSPAEPEHGDASGDVWKGQLSGWISTFIYTSANVSQIFRNFETRCNGLSPMMYYVAMTGSTTFALSILTQSTERAYLLRNASWLIGNAIGITLDIIILWQIRRYRLADRKHVGS